jgi:hypothetical protein
MPGMKAATAAIKRPSLIAIFTGDSTKIRVLWDHPNGFNSEGIYQDMGRL